MPTDTPLHKAAHNGDLNQVKQLVESGECGEVDAPGASDRRAIHRAAGGNHVEIIQYLLSKGSAVDVVGSSKIFFDNLLFRLIKVVELRYIGLQLVVIKSLVRF